MNENLPATTVNEQGIVQTTNNIAQQIMDCEDPEQSKRLVDLFNWNIAKKNAIRILKLSGVFDKLTDQLWERAEKTPGNFDNDQLITALKTAQDLLDKSQKALGQVEDVPAIQIQKNTQVNINVLDSFDQDSKERIANAIKTILAQNAKNTIVVEQENNITEEENNIIEEGNKSSDGSNQTSEE